MEKKQAIKITRDNFNPSRVIGLIYNGHLASLEALRLLEEACHALMRERVRIDQIKRKSAELHAITIEF